MIGIEFLDGLEQPFVADGHQLGEVESVALVFLDIGDHEPEVRGDQPLGCRLVSGNGLTGKPLFLVRIRDHGELLDVE